MKNETIYCPNCVTALVPYKKQLGGMDKWKKWKVCPDCGYVDSSADHERANDKSLEDMKERQKKAEISINQKYESDGTE